MTIFDGITCNQPTMHSLDPISLVLPKRYSSAPGANFDMANFVKASAKSYKRVQISQPVTEES